ncbi:glycosyltransferase [Hydrogenimonas sp.]
MCISVLMTVYKNDNKSHFDEAFSSIWNQTLKPKQIVLVIDGPVGHDLEKVIYKWKLNLRDILTIIYNEKNIGLAKSLNKGLQYCKCHIIARMDSDDISLPERFETEYQYMQRNPTISMIGSWYNIYDEKMEKIIDKRQLPILYKDIKKIAKLRTPINHPTIMFKKKAAIQAGGYPENIGRFEDWGISLKFIKKNLIIENIPKNLLKFRGGQDLLNRRGGVKYLKEEYKAIYNLYKMELIGLQDLFINIIIRTPIRLLPINTREKFYKIIRKPILMNKIK